MAQALIRWTLNTRRDDVEHKACVQCHHAGSGSMLAPPIACVMYCRERTSTRETVERKLWNKIVFVLFAQKVFSWLHKITVDRLMSHGLLCRSSWYFSGPWSCKDPCCLWEGLRALRFKQKYLNLCSEDEQRSYGFGTTSGWVINDIIFIFGWTNPFIFQDLKDLHHTWLIFDWLVYLCCLVIRCHLLYLDWLRS